MVLRHLLKSGKTRLSFNQLNKLMQNVESEQFSYEVFKAAFDQDPAIQNIVQDFDEKTLTLGDDPKLDKSSSSGGDSVGTMAKRATDLTDL